MTRQKTVGVIGGLGPEATLDFFAKLLRATNAKTDQEHLHVIINNNPKVPNRHASIAGTGPSAVPALVETAQALERAGADFLVMACNTAHAYEADIRAATALPFLSMIDVTLKTCASRTPRPQRIGLLAADGCLATGLYQTRLEAEGIGVLCPNEAQQKQLMEIIFKVKAGDVSDAPRRKAEVLAQTLVDQGADMVLAACTEIPLVLSGDNVRRPLVSSTDALVEATVDYATSSP